MFRTHVIFSNLIRVLSFLITLAFLGCGEDFQIRSEVPEDRKITAVDKDVLAEVYEAEQDEADEAKKDKDKEDPDKDDPEDQIDGSPLLLTWDYVINDFPLYEDSPVLGVVASAADEESESAVTYGFDPDNMTCDDGAWENLFIDPATGLILGIPTNDDVGECTMMIVATNEMGSISHGFTITVVNTNDEPVWDLLVDNFYLVESSSITEKFVHAKDVDAGETPTYSLDEAGTSCNIDDLSVDSTSGEIRGTPAAANECIVSVKASSGNDEIFHQFALVVANNVGSAFWFVRLENFEQPEDVELSGKSVQAIDLDETGNITYSFDTDNMSCDDNGWLTIDSDTGVLSGIPGSDDLGECSVKIFAASSSDTLEQIFTITVVNSNDQPVWDLNPDSFVAYQGVPEISPVAGLTPRLSQFPLTQ